MFNILKKLSSAPPARHGIPENKPIKVEYFSKEVPLPDDFLPPVPTASDAQPMTMTPVDWKTTKLPEYDGRYAVVVDNVLSQSECDELIRLAEASVERVRLGDDNATAVGGQNGPAQQQERHNFPDPWRPAMINAGGGYEVLDTTYRHSDRIIWDSQDVVDRLWARCMQGDVGAALRERLAVLQGNEGHKVVGGYKEKGEEWTQRWEMRRLNRRMRFLRYGPGQFFKRESCLEPFFPLLLLADWSTLKYVNYYTAHCDSYYIEEIDGQTLRTMFTVHLYLNDSVAEAGEGNAKLVGGATSFLSSDDKRKVDVDPKAGRVLIFQHFRLNHSGDEVTKGTKYTMRTEVMYERVDN